MRFVLFVYVCFILPFCGFAQQDAKATPINSTPILLTQVAIGIPNLKTEQFNLVKSSLKAIKGVTWTGYCEDQYYVFLLVDRFIQKDDKNITDVLLDINKNFKLYFKTASFDLLLNNCRDKEKAMSR